MTSELRRKLQWNLAFNIAHPEDMKRKDLAEIFLHGVAKPIELLIDEDLISDFVDVFGDRPAGWVKSLIGKADIAEGFTADEEYELLTLVRQATKRVDEEGTK